MTVSRQAGPAAGAARRRTPPTGEAHWRGRWERGCVVLHAADAVARAGLEIAPTCHTQVDAVSAAGARATVADDGVVPMRHRPADAPWGGRGAGSGCADQSWRNRQRAGSVRRATDRMLAPARYRTGRVRYQAALRRLPRTGERLVPVQAAGVGHGVLVDHFSMGWPSSSF